MCFPSARCWMWCRWSRHLVLTWPQCLKILTSASVQPLPGRYAYCGTEHRRAPMDSNKWVAKLPMSTLLQGSNNVIGRRSCGAWYLRACFGNRHIVPHFHSPGKQFRSLHSTKKGWRKDETCLAAHRQNGAGAYSGARALSMGSCMSPWWNSCSVKGQWKDEHVPSSSASW